jgi:hypothetical protein
LKLPKVHPQWLVIETACLVMVETIAVLLKEEEEEEI